MKGTVPILLVAGHNCPHMREGRQKPRDIGTGELAKKLCGLTQSWGMVTTTIQRDPNWHEDAPFRLAVKKLVAQQNIQAVIDLHGRREGYPHLIEYYPNKYFRAKYKTDPTLTIDIYKSSQFTLVKDLEQEQVACMAIEIRKDGRTNEGNGENYQKMPLILAEMIKLIDY